MKFLWGAATSSHQIDGDNRHSDWWHWEQQGNIETGETSGAATDHWNRYAEDLERAAALGLTTYRFSIEWARIEPQEGQWNREALAWYERLVDECERRGLLPMATLHHFTLPQWLAAKGGLASEHFADRFAGYVRKVAPLLAPRIPLWCTINEPVALVVGAYIGSFMPPATNQPALASRALRHLLRAHVLAYDILHANRSPRRGPWRDEPFLVGVAHNMIDFQPRHPSKITERILSRLFRRFYNRAWLDAVTGRKQHFGVWGFVPYPRQVWEARRRSTIDFIGVNYYTKVLVCWGPQREGAAFGGTRAPVGVRFALPGEAASDLGWAIHPHGLARLLRFVKRYRLPIFITENGIADADDTRRKEYLRAHLGEVAAAREKGADIRGYYYWSLLDNFEWIKGFTPRFGLFAVDYATQTRAARPSAHWYAQVIAAHRELPDHAPHASVLNRLP